MAVPCFSLSLRDVELILAARGIVVSYETIREWGLRFGRLFANDLRHDDHGPATNAISMRSSSASAASCIISGVPSIRTGTCSISSCRAREMPKLRIYGAAKRDIMPAVEHRHSRM
jgi:putative transposase